MIMYISERSELVDFIVLSFKKSLCSGRLAHLVYHHLMILIELNSSCGKANVFCDVGWCQTVPLQAATSDLLSIVSTLLL